MAKIFKHECRNRFSHYEEVWNQEALGKRSKLLACVVMIWRDARHVSPLPAFFGFTEFITVYRLMESSGKLSIDEQEKSSLWKRFLMLLETKQTLRYVLYQTRCVLWTPFLKNVSYRFRRRILVCMNYSQWHCNNYFSSLFFLTCISEDLPWDLFSSGM